jgi:transposase InsO family protein
VKDVESFCDSCGICQTTKASTSRPKGLLHLLPIPEAPWQSIAMDFVGPFPECMGYDHLLVVICRLTSLVHLIPTTTSAKATEIAWLFLKDIVRCHGLPKNIVSDRDPKFVPKFWRELHRLMGVKLLMSTAYHPQTGLMGEYAITGVNHVLRGVVTHDQTDWVDRLPTEKFAINSSVNDSTGFAPFELAYGAVPCIFHKTIITPCFGVKSLAEKALTNLAIAHDSIIANSSIQTHYANKHRSAEEPLKECDLVYLSTKNLDLPEHRARKLMPIFIGPYPVVKLNSDTSNYTSKLPFPTLSPEDPTGGQSLGTAPSAMDPINLRFFIHNDGYDYGRYAHGNP